MTFCKLVDQAISSDHFPAVKFLIVMFSLVVHFFVFTTRHLKRFANMGVSSNGGSPNFSRFLMRKSDIEMDDLGVPPF